MSKTALMNYVKMQAEADLYCLTCGNRLTADETVLCTACDEYRWTLCGDPDDE